MCGRTDYSQHRHSPGRHLACASSSLCCLYLSKDMFHPQMCRNHTLLHQPNLNSHLPYHRHFSLEQTLHFRNQNFLLVVEDNLQYLNEYHPKQLEFLQMVGGFLSGKGCMAGRKISEMNAETTLSQIMSP